MSDNLQEVILSEEGYILSDGTLNLNHLLSKVYDLLVYYDLNPKLRSDILSVFEIDGSFDKEYSLFTKQYYDKARILDEKMDDANTLWNEDIFYFLNELSPDQYYFGSHEGDGACIGWFKYENEIDC